VPWGKRTRFFWLAEHDSHGVIGAGELRVRSRPHRQGEISYIVHPDHWGHGYATRIANRLLELAFREHTLHRVFATCDSRNVASAAVLRKIGMTYEGRMRHALLLRDGWRDSEIFSILDSEWTHRAETDRIRRQI
jgi:RimJ/RimL family protein N-acetyltransferase